MAVRIRMKRLGRKHRPFYRICVIDQKKARDGKPIEEIGTYDPMIKDKSKRVVIRMDRVDYWTSVGAQPSEKVAVLVEKVRKGNWGTAKAPPPLTPPKEPTAAAPEGEAAEAPAEAAAE
ncbi:MAG: 30S ribosomal protein S16 [Planctomycetaceae bacterium]